MQDGRRKIDPKDYEEVRLDYAELKSQRKTAEKWNVDKRTIQFILSPERYAEFKRKRYLLAPWREYYSKDKWKEDMRKYRAKKRKHNLLNKPKSPCVQCGKKLDQNGKRQKFCSMKCSWDFHNKKRYATNERGNKPFYSRSFNNDRRRTAVGR